MAIWLDTALGDGTSDNDYARAECPDCTHALDETHNILPLIEDDIQLVRTGLWNCTPSLLIQECGDRRWLITNPIGSGRLAVIDSAAFSILKQFQRPVSLTEVMQNLAPVVRPLAERTIALFCKLGFLSNGDEFVFHPREMQPQTLSAWMHVTNACNLRCHYCYLQKTSEHMANETARRAIDAIFRSARKRHFSIVLLKYAGGEASLHMANVLAIHDYATYLAQQLKIELRAYIISNGVALSQKAIDNLKARRIGVTISLDGIGTYHDSQRPFTYGQGSFKYVDRTISRLLAKGFPPHIAVTVSKRNVDGLSKLIEYILQRELSFSISYYRENDCATHTDELRFDENQMIAGMHAAFAVIEQYLPKRSLLDTLLDKASLRTTHQHTCGAGRNYLVVDQNGLIARCHADIKRTVTSAEAEDPLAVIQHERDGFQNLAVDDKEGCKSCEWRYWCTGGCPLMTYRATGRNDVKSPNCNIYKALFPAALRLEALRLLKYEAPVIL